MTQEGFLEFSLGCLPHGGMRMKGLVTETSVLDTAEGMKLEQHLEFD